MGRHCRELAVTLKIGNLDEGSASLDHEATWLLGHTEWISFGTLRTEGDSLLVDATLHVTCRYLKAEAASGTCEAYGFRAPLPVRRAPRHQPRRLPGERFRVVDRQRQRDLTLPLPSYRSLPVLGANPCATAPCATADHRQGAACCRDLQLEILCTEDDFRREALVRSRRSPYLCKIERNSAASLDVEMISACDYLDARRSCTLHGRTRPDGRTAKPDLCSEWPPKGQGLHPGCVFGPRGGRRRPA